MSKLSSIEAIEIFDSRGQPTVSVKVQLDDGSVGEANVPSGASTGLLEALELRDGGKRLQGKGVKQAISHVLGPIKDVLLGQEADPLAVDETLMALDGTENKSKLGANSLLGVSMAVVRAAAVSAKEPLYQYLHRQFAIEKPLSLPCPMFNVLNGGAHSDNNLDFQEFMVRPFGASSFREAMEWGAEIYGALKAQLKAQGLSIAVGDEGGFAPHLASDEQALDLLCQAIEKAGLKAGEQVSLALDCAASWFYDEKHRVYIERKKRDKKEAFKEHLLEEQVQHLEKLAQAYPIDSIEDGLFEADWEGWQLLTKKLGKKLQLVGDDIFVTNCKLLQKGMDLGVANAILIKVNQIGTVKEAIEACRLAQSSGYNTVISHRSGETEDSFIADFSVALGAGQIKTGAPARSERIAKYNRLLWIEHEGNLPFSGR